MNKIIFFETIIILLCSTKRLPTGLIFAYEKNLCIICCFKYLCGCFFSNKVSGNKMEE